MKECSMPIHPWDDDATKRESKPAVSKRSRGKPPMGDAARTVGFTVKMTKIEYIKWKTMAAEQDKSLSEFILAPLRIEKTEEKRTDSKKKKADR